MNTKIEIKDHVEVRVIGAHEEVRVIMTTDKYGTKFLNLNHSPTMLVKQDPRCELKKPEKWMKHFFSY